jgi:hypothetical protein
MTFAAMPPVPMVGLDSFIAAFMLSTKQNVELLTGQYGDIRFRSVLKGQVTVLPASGSLQQLTAKGAGYDIAGGAGVVPTIEDYQELLKSVQLLVNDVEVMRQTLNALITQLKA